MAFMTRGISMAVQCRNKGKQRSRDLTGTVPFLTYDPVAKARNSAVVKNWYSPLAAQGTVPIFAHHFPCHADNWILRAKMGLYPLSSKNFPISTAKIQLVT